ncbi:MAG: methyltransferase domain-containing protein [Cytophagales bacterium]|nr:methyltransferase domain-containing protein [Cytophagales bacterium]
MNPARTVEWFDEWFNSPYYHILYKHRDDSEAHLFIDNLATFLPITPEDKILDLACGKGRHAIYLNQKGFDVIGVDLSERNIRYAQKFANSRLQFFRHDKRSVFRKEYFTVLLNLFTSFGYFETDIENIGTLQAAASNLKTGGRMVIDFMNTPKVISQLPTQEQKTIDGICFEICKRIENRLIIKDIRFLDNGKPYHFQERLMIITQADFERYFRLAGLQILHILGDYHLKPYTPESDRMIFVLKK